MQGVTAIGLGPTVLGVGALGLLFMVPLIVKLIRMTTTSPAQGKRSGFAADVPEEEAFDADAALARYLARKAEAGEDPPIAVAAEAAGGSAETRPVFGRKIT